MGHFLNKQIQINIFLDLLVMHIYSVYCHSLPLSSSTMSHFWEFYICALKTKIVVPNPALQDK